MAEPVDSQIAILIDPLEGWTANCKCVGWNAMLTALVMMAIGGTEIAFEDVSASRGIGPYEMESGMSGGVALADYDGDGDVDLFAPNAFGHPAQLYRNRGDGVFDEIAAAVGLDSTEGGRAALWLDLDGDDRLDLIVASDFCNGQCPPTRALRGYVQNTRGLFDDRTSALGLDGLVALHDGMHVGGLAAGDFDGDHDLDVVVSYWEGERLFLRNDADGVLRERAADAGLAAGPHPCWAPVAYDFDRDGHLDLLHAIDFLANELWMNSGDAQFTDIAAQCGADNAMNDMGVALGDYDNDGDLDIYITNMVLDGKHNVLLRNDRVNTTLAFDERSGALDVQGTGCGWGTTFFDADLDGRLDLAATNGAAGGPCATDASRFWWNDGAAFVDRSTEVGFDDTDWGGTLLAADLDRDGDVEMVQACMHGPLRLLDNRSRRTGHWLRVRPRRSQGNRRAIGAVVRVETADGVSQMRLITAGTSLLGQEPAEAHFGLDSNEMVERVTVEWAEGGVNEWFEVPVDRDLLLYSHCGADFDLDGRIDFSDLVALLAGWGPCGGSCAHDLDDDGVVDVNDLADLVTRWGPCTGN